MPINPNIALSGRPIEIPKAPDPMEQYARFVSIRNAIADQQRQNALAPLQIAAAQSANALNQYNLSSKQEEDLRETQYRNALLNAKTPEEQLTVLGKYKPADAIAARKLIAEQTKANLDSRLTKSKLVASALDNARGFLATLDTSDPAAAASQAVRMFDGLIADSALSDDLKTAGYTSEVVRDMFARALETNTVPQLIQSMSVQADKLAEMKAKTYQNEDLGGTVKTWETDKLGNRRLIGTENKTAAPQGDTASWRDYQKAKTPEGGNFPGTFEDWERIKSPSGDEGGLKNPLVPFIDEDGKVRYGTRSEAQGKQPPSEATGLAPAEIRKREAAYPQATLAVKEVTEKTATLAKQMRELAKHPGLWGITGAVYGRTPSVTAPSLEAQALLDNIMGKGTLGTLTALRNASKTGGGLGNVSNKDTGLLEAAFGALNQAQSTDSFRNALNAAADELEGTSVRAKEAYDDTYQYRNKDDSGAVDINNPLLAK